MGWLAEYKKAKEQGCFVFYNEGDIEREYVESKKPYDEDPPRHPFWKDYQRVISAPSFRRLKGKTQLFPGNESDFFRCRLTHSLEVAHIGKSIALRINDQLREIYENKGLKTHPYFSFIDTDLVEFACISHDIGHPPFGHQGEDELNKQTGSFNGFEGNAQTLRILTRLEKKFTSESTGFFSDPTGISNTGIDNRHGINPTFRSIASILKYDKPIPSMALYIDKEGNEFEKKPNEYVSRKGTKGYYGFDTELIKKVKKKVLGGYKLPRNNTFKTIECQIMDIADDIAYSIYDLEDSFKGGFINMLDFLKVDEGLLRRIAEKINSKIMNLDLNAKNVYNILRIPLDVLNLSVASSLFTEPHGADLATYISSETYRFYKTLSRNGYVRTEYFSQLVGDFINKIHIVNFVQECPGLSTIDFRENNAKNYTNGVSNTKILIDILKRFTYEFQIESPKLKIVEHRGKEIVGAIFEAIKLSDGRFLPEDKRKIYDTYKEALKADPIKQNEFLIRTICDFVASMTDKYAFDYYSRLKSENAQSIFKEM